MVTIEQFYETIKKEQTLTLATAGENSVTMRTVSPVLYQGAILIFTSANSKKYQQLQRNPHCCIAIGPFFAEAKAEFCGATMRSENSELRAAYCEKFPNAFDEDTEFGGRNAEFILLKPTRLSGWTFQDGIASSNAIPTIPFDISLSDAGDNNLTPSPINIAPCGLICTQCDACRATRENSPEKLELVAAHWRKLNNCDDILAEHIPCEGCMNTTGRKSFFCANMCEIRRCAIEKKKKVCSECPDFPCEKLSGFLKMAPEQQANAMRKLLDAIVDVEQNTRSIF